MTKTIRRLLVLYVVMVACASLALQTARAQEEAPLAIVMTADGPVMPPMREYIQRGIQAAEQRGAEVLIIELNTPGGDLLTTLDIIANIRASKVPVVVYVAPHNAMAGSAGALITVAAHASAMAPETIIGASSPIDSSGQDLNSDARAKATNASKAAIRDIVSPREPEALALAEAMIDDAKAATANEALATAQNKRLDGFICLEYCYNLNALLTSQTERTCKPPYLLSSNLSTNCTISRPRWRCQSPRS